jgi:hypothetical protein
MGRPPRIDIPGLVYHVFNRGVKQLPIFLDTEDRLEFIDWLIETRRRYAIDIEQYSLIVTAVGRFPRFSWCCSPIAPAE